MFWWIPLLVAFLVPVWAVSQNLSIEDSKHVMSYSPWAGALLIAVIGVPFSLVFTNIGNAIKATLSLNLRTYQEYEVAFRAPLIRAYKVVFATYALGIFLFMMGMFSSVFPETSKPYQAGILVGSCTYTITAALLLLYWLRVIEVFHREIQYRVEEKKRRIEQVARLRGSMEDNPRIREQDMIKGDVTKDDDRRT